MTKDWLKYVHSIVFDRVGAEAGESLFEVGCGAGAFLLPLYRKGLHVAGLDFSPALVAQAARVMPGVEIGIAQAIDLSPTPKFSCILSNSVFHYFPDLTYAKRVVDLMLAKATRKVVILDVPDAELRRPQTFTHGHGHQAPKEAPSLPEELHSSIDATRDKATDFWSPKARRIATVARVGRTIHVTGSYSTE